MSDLILQVSETNYMSETINNKTSDEWVIRNLKQYGNCLINKNSKHNFDYIEEKVGKFTKRDYDNCYILEVIK